MKANSPRYTTDTTIFAGMKGGFRRDVLLQPQDAHYVRVRGQQERDVTYVMAMEHGPVVSSKGQRYAKDAKGLGIIEIIIS